MLGFSLSPGVCRWLFTGVDTEIFNAQPSVPVWDAMLPGYMHVPMSDDLLSKMVKIRGQNVGKVGDLVDGCLAQGFRNRNGDLSRLRAYLLSRFREHIPDLAMAEIPPYAFHIFDDHLLRLVDRFEAAQGMLAATSNVAFIGNDGWAQWPQFAPFYGGSHDRPRDLADVYRKARVIVHDSNTSMHHRVMEAMACGRPVLVNRNLHDGTFADIRRYFEEGEDFLVYDHATLGESLATALSDKWRLEKIGRNAARKIRKRHRWRDRAAQIAKDFASL
jgi:glycosyltransferase involved in cell wall biosynthesis